MEKAAAALHKILLDQPAPRNQPQNVETSHTLLLSQTLNKTSQNSTPVTSYYQTYAPCPHIQGSRAFFLTTTVSSGTSACTKQTIYSDLMLPFPAQFPSWHYWWIESFHSGSPTWGCFNSQIPCARWLHLSHLWVSTSFLPKPLRERRLIILLNNNVPNDCLSWPMGLSSETGTVARCQHCSLATRPPFLFILPLSDAHDNTEVGM